MNNAGKRLGIPKDRPYWFLGASFGGSEDQTGRFLKEGIWENGYEDRYLDLVREIEPGDRVAIKATYTMKRGLPFEHDGPAVSVMAIKAIGTVRKNPGDGRRLEVAWEEQFEPPREWYFFTYRATVWKVEATDWCREGLCRFAFFGEPQEIDRFRNHPYWRDRYGNESDAGRALDRLLDRIANAAGLSGRREASQMLMRGEPWDEIPYRRTFLADAYEALHTRPIDMGRLRKCFARSNIMASISSNTMTSDFFKSANAPQWLEGLAGRSVFGASDLDRMIDELVDVAFTGSKDGRPRRSEAARFLSVLLAALDPDEYMEYRESHARALARWVGAELHGETHGERIMALRDLYRAIRASSEFQEYFGEEQEFPNAVVGGLAWILKDGGKALIADLKQEQNNGGVDMNEENRSGKDKTNGAPANLLLYGPPGTGKTYHTIFRAVEICDGDKPSSYEEAKSRFDELKAEGRVEFVTFHQSYGYEEFIEGIRAETMDGKISYTVADGLLKTIAFRATTADATFTFDQVYNELTTRIENKEKVEARLSNEKAYCSIVDVKRSGSIAVKPASPRSGADHEYSVTREKLESMWPKRGKLNKPKDLEEFNLTTTDSSYYLAVLRKLEEILDDMVRDFSHRSPREKPYVLIIDEINRGNISKIFGELITLIEDDKRIGAGHEMLVRLPLSGDAFGVPKNLYIIGTMNTADRSIAMMDTALRRRFVFEEMMPDPELLGGITVQGVDVAEMLRVMNRRIEVLYDREHTIGHAWFMPLKEKPNLELLASIFENKIIPLLAEYFFEDWGRIRLVLGDNQKRNQRFEFITEQSVNGQDSLFGEGLPDVLDWDDRKVHGRNPEALGHPESYIGIYNPKVCAATGGGDHSGESRAEAAA